MPSPPARSLLQNKLSQERIAEIVTEAVAIEKEFICDALPVDLIGMNGRLMSQVGRFACGRTVSCILPGCGGRGGSAALQCRHVQGAAMLLRRASCSCLAVVAVSPNPPPALPALTAAVH